MRAGPVDSSAQLRPVGALRSHLVRSVGEVALDVPIVDARIALPDLDAMFRERPDLRAVLTRSHGRWQLVSRTYFDDVLAGRFGYGRALAVRRHLDGLLPRDTLVLPAGTSVGAAADAVLERSGQWRYDDIVVDEGDTARVVPVAALFAALAGEFQSLALTDSLTGLPNRFAVHDAMSRLDGAELRRIALLYIDLDQFKDVNDTFGHRIGDEVLREFAQRLRDCVRPHDSVARLGGDEFLVVLRDIDGVGAAAVGERILLSAAAPFVVHGQVLTLGASVGIALSGDVPGERQLSTAEVLLRHADAAMYRAKSQGRGRVVQLDHTHEPVPHGVAAELQHAMSSGELHLHYQPKYHLESNRLIEVEALCRWTHPTRGAIPPVTFIPIAEKTGLIVALGRWVLERSCRQLRTWLDAGCDLGMSVNLSPVQLATPGLVDDVAEILHATGVPADRVRLEITETAAIEDLPATEAKLTQLRALGVKVSLDDFGTGYSSLAMLRHLPLDGVKIDKSFVDNIVTDDADAALVGLIIQAAHDRGLRVIAEGVEHAEQLERLRELGCDGAQGYLLGRPSPAELIHPSTSAETATSLL